MHLKIYLQLVGAERCARWWINQKQKATETAREEGERETTSEALYYLAIRWVSCGGRGLKIENLDRLFRGRCKIKTEKNGYQRVPVGTNGYQRVPTDTNGYQEYQEDQDQFSSATCISDVVFLFLDLRYLLFPTNKHPLSIQGRHEYQMWRQTI